MERLKPCAHCGNDDIEGPLEKQINWTGGKYYETIIECKCGASMSYHGSSIKDVMEEIKKKWNRRASPWVIVDDRFPTHEDGTFLVSGLQEYPSADKSYRTVYLGYIGAKNLEVCKDGCKEYFEPTHWMPRPEIER